MKYSYLILACALLSCIACTKHQTTTNFCPGGSGSPITGQSSKLCSSDPCTIYKTKYDYSNFISVQLSDDKTQVLAYPFVLDVHVQHPIPLANGYYLKRMLGNAFTSIRFGEYDTICHYNFYPSLFTKRLIDCNPFTEYWEGCGTDTAYINSLIRSGTLSTSFDKVN